MAVTPPNQGGGLTPEEKELREQVRYLDEQAMSMKNLLTLKQEAVKAAKQEKTLQEQIKALGREQVRNAALYNRSSKEIKQIEETIYDARIKGDKALAKDMEKYLKEEKKKQEAIQRTSGGALAAILQEARKRKESLQAERDLIKDINKERGVGSKIMDLFRSKEEKQRQIALARARAGGGANLPPGGGGGDGGGEGGGEEAALAGAGPYGMIAGALIGAAKKLVAPLKVIKDLAKDALMAPFADAAALLTGEDVGMGGGKLKTTGASSILGGMEKLASSIPFIGGLLGGLASAFKMVVEAVLGLEQADFRAARALNLSVGATQRMRANFDAMVASSGNLALNSTRMMESQIEIGNQLGINKQLSGDILANNVLLKEVVGVEAESRQRIAETSIITGKNATVLTKNLMGSVSLFNKLTGTSFTFKAIMQEASKLSGLMGLAFAKFPEKLAKTLMITKAFGFELKQLDGIAGSFLDFESSISKEMEAQVLTGKEMNLTAAREAALNNDNAKLASEITKNVGDANAYLKMNRIQQEAIAESVGMTRDSLADVLRKQEMYAKLGATDLKTFHKKIELMEQEVNGREKIIAKIGEANYQEYTRLSTAEKISEVMEKIKMTFINFVKASGLFDFITKPERVNAFIKFAVEKLAGAVGLIGEVMASILDFIAWIPGTDTAKWKGLASSVRSGTSAVTGGMTSAVSSLGGSPAPSLSNTAEGGARQQTEAERQAAEYAKQSASAAAALASSAKDNSTAKNGGNYYLIADGQVLAKLDSSNQPQNYAGVVS